MNSPPFIHSFWTNSNCRSISALMKRLIRPRSTPSSSSMPSVQMRAVLDAAPEQSVPSYRGRAFQRCRPRIAATQMRTDRTPQALIVACICEIVATLRIRCDRGIILIGGQIHRTTAAPAPHHFRRHEILMIIGHRCRTATSRRLPDSGEMRPHLDTVCGRPYRFR